MASEIVFAPFFVIEFEISFDKTHWAGSRERGENKFYKMQPSKFKFMKSELQGRYLRGTRVGYMIELNWL